MTPWLAILFFAYVTVNGHDCKYEQVGLATNNLGEMILMFDTVNVRLDVVYQLKDKSLLVTSDTVFYSFVSVQEKSGFVMFLNELKYNGEIKAYRKKKIRGKYKVDMKKFDSVNAYMISTRKCDEN